MTRYEPNIPGGSHSCPDGQFVRYEVAQALREALDGLLSAIVAKDRANAIAGPMERGQAAEVYSDAFSTARAALALAEKKGDA